MPTIKPAKPPAADAPAHRRSQPVRQTRTNPPRSSVNSAYSTVGTGREAGNNASSGSQPIENFPAITHFADTISALPKELVRHFTLLKEVDAKLFAPEEQLFKLTSAAATASAPPTETRPSREGPGMALSTSPPVTSAAEGNPALSNVFDPSNVPLRHLFRQTALKLQEMLVSLEEKNHVISTANEALQRQLTRVEDVWPYLENEFSDEAKWGSPTHWAYPVNRSAGKVSHTERARRDGAAAISAAAQALADEAAARSDARKQAVQAKRSQKNQHHDSDADDHDARQKGEGGKKTSNGKARKTADAHVGLGISGASATNGNPPTKRRKVEKTTNGASGGGAPMERVMSNALGNNGSKAKTNSPRGTPALDAPKKRKALHSGSGQTKKKNNGPRGSPSLASSPVTSALPEPKINVPASPVLANAPRPASSRVRNNSMQSNADTTKVKALLPAMSKAICGNGAASPDAVPANFSPRTVKESKAANKEANATAKSEPINKEGERFDANPGLAIISSSSSSKKESKADDCERKSEYLPPPPSSSAGVATVTTKSGRTSKPSTPALVNAQEPTRPRSSRNIYNGTGGKKSQKRGISIGQVPACRSTNDDMNSGLQGGGGGGEDDDEGQIDADEPTYCYCNSVSYGEMVACDADGCEREWFHLACVGLRVALEASLQRSGTARTAKNDSKWAARIRTVDRAVGSRVSNARPPGLDWIEVHHRGPPYPALFPHTSRGLQMARCLHISQGVPD